MSIKIGFINHSSTLYGANRSLINLIDGLRDYNIQPFVILRQPGELSALLERRGVPTTYVPYRLWVDNKRMSRYRAKLAKFIGEQRVYQRDWDDEKNINEISNYFSDCGVDLIHSNSSVFPAGFFVARKLRIPHVWHLREFLENYDFHFLHGEKKAREIIRSSDACIAISRSVKEYFLDSYSTSAKMHVIYNGVMSRKDFDRLKSKVTERKKEPFKFVFGMMGRIHPSKGFDEGIRAFAKIFPDFPQARLAIAGGGATPPLKRLTDKLGIASRVDFLGFFQDPNEFYGSIDALLMCSRKEAMGRVTIEANASCKPVIGLDAAGTSELIDHGRTGFLYRGGSDNLAEVMKQCLECPQKLRQMGVEAWEIARNRFTNEIYAREFYRVVQKLMAK